MDEFDAKTQEQIGYYVYCLVNPDTKKPFYIGKGKGNRVFDHAKDKLTGTVENDKIETIRKILKQDKKVEYLIIQHGLNEKNRIFARDRFDRFFGLF
ncbi:GIY-YIG nuclease family protein [Parasulfitobacter algicola]|nr:GIY-YIG nuclease family protein [Sulfitobacter algicola]